MRLTVIDLFWTRIQIEWRANINQTSFRWWPLGSTQYHRLLQLLQPVALNSERGQWRVNRPEWSFYNLHIFMSRNPRNPQHFTDVEIASWTISGWLAGRGGSAPANRWSLTTRFPRQKSAVDNYSFNRAWKFRWQRFLQSWYLQYRRPTVSLIAKRGLVDVLE